MAILNVGVLNLQLCFPTRCVLSTYPPTPDSLSVCRTPIYLLQILYLCVEHLSTHSRFSVDSGCPFDSSTYMLNVTFPPLICCPRPNQRALHPEMIAYSLPRDIGAIRLSLFAVWSLLLANQLPSLPFPSYVMRQPHQVSITSLNKESLRAFSL